MCRGAAAEACNRSSMYQALQHIIIMKCGASLSLKLKVIKLTDMHVIYAACLSSCSAQFLAPLAHSPESVAIMLSRDICKVQCGLQNSRRVHHSDGEEPAPWKWFPGDPNNPYKVHCVMCFCVSLPDRISVRLEHAHFQQKKAAKVLVNTACENRVVCWCVSLYRQSGNYTGKLQYCQHTAQAKEGSIPKPLPMRLCMCDAMTSCNDLAVKHCYLVVQLCVAICGCLVSLLLLLLGLHDSSLVL